MLIKYISIHINTVYIEYVSAVFGVLCQNTQANLTLEKVSKTQCFVVTIYNIFNLLCTYIYWIHTDAMITDAVINDA